MAGTEALWAASFRDRRHHRHCFDETNNEPRKEYHCTAFIWVDDGRRAAIDLASENFADLSVDLFLEELSCVPTKPQNRAIKKARQGVTRKTTPAADSTTTYNLRDTTNRQLASLHEIITNPKTAVAVIVSIDFALGYGLLWRSASDNLSEREAPVRWPCVGVRTR